MRFKDIWTENFFEIKEAIVKTVAYFDMFDFPLTGFEIWRNLPVKCKLSEVIGELENISQGISQNIAFQEDKIPLTPFAKGGKCKMGNIESKNGFYFLAGREAIVETRLARYASADRKFKRVLRIMSVYKFIPWIKMAAVSNLMGAHNLREASDIDLFIITEPKRIWLTRFFCVFLAKLLGLRPEPDDNRDKICLSFFVSDEALDLRPLMLDNPILEGKRTQSPLVPLYQGGKYNPPSPFAWGSNRVDIYFVYWLAGLTPIYENDRVYEKLIQLNGWLKEYLPNWPACAEAPAREQIRPWSRRRDAGGSPGKFYRDMVDLFFGGLEPWFKKIELKMLPKDLRELMNLDTRVAINDSVLKLHANDRREEYRNRFNNLVVKILH
jgi:hypothetical protein